MKATFSNGRFVEAEERRRRERQISNSLQSSKGTLAINGLLHSAWQCPIAPRPFLENMSQGTLHVRPCGAKRAAHVAALRPDLGELHKCDERATRSPFCPTMQKSYAPPETSSATQLKEFKEAHHSQYLLLPHEALEVRDTSSPLHLPLLEIRTPAQWNDRFPEGGRQR